MWLFLPVFFFILCLNVYSVAYRSVNLNYVTKPLLLVSLIIYYLVSPGTPVISVMLALLAGLAGDIFLMLPDSNKYFIPGLLSFLIGHLFFIFSFVRISAEAGETGIWFYMLSAIFLAFGIFINVKLIPRAGKLGIFIILYVLTITSMGISSLLSLKLATNASFLLPIIGALLFILSDTLLSFAKFRVIKDKSGMVMFTYGLAQLFLTLWFAFCKI